MAELPYLQMRRHLSEAVEAPVWRDGLYLQSFTDRHAQDAHALLMLAYANGGGSVPAFKEWWSALSQDSEYDPALCFMVRDAQGKLVGFAQCWTSNFVKDFVVHPQYRRRGIGRTLLLHIFRVFQARGVEAVDLKVQVDNPSGAIQLYESLGMSRV